MNIKLCITTLITISYILVGQTFAVTLPKHLLKLDIEQLMQIEITSAAKHPQKLSEAPAAIYVITSEDIHHSFTNHIPELLRDVPGVHVARTASHVWAISIRGFNDRFANKLLVLMDGRTLYTPLFSGVFWDEQDTILDDIDRIEVIRGPGASLWGANAVNGVINIVNKNAKQTQGFLGSVVAGDEESKATLRYGGLINQKTAYRFYIKAKEVDSLKKLHNGSTHDDWRMLKWGFRLDKDLNSNKTFTLISDMFSITAGALYEKQSLTAPYGKFEITDGYNFGANIIGKLKKNTPNNNWYIQAYYDTSRATGYPLLNWKLNTFDIEFQQNFLPFSSHEITWGLGYRLYLTEVKKSASYEYKPSNKNIYILNSFFQDEISLIRNKVSLILGSKFEYHDITGLEIQPSLRILWKINQDNIFWASISRATRTPSIGEKDAIIQMIVPPSYAGFRFPFSSMLPPTPIHLILEGNDNLDSEKLIAFELGYRKEIANKISLDITAFFNKYDDLIALVAPNKIPTSKNLPVPHLEVISSAENIMDGETYGLEIDSKIDLTSNWRLYISYSYLKLFLHSSKKTLYLGEDLEKLWPTHILSLRSRYELPKNFFFDFRIRYVDKIKGYSIPAYWATDLRLAWHPNDHLELSVVGQNIFDPKHPEFGQSYALRNPLREIERNFFIKILYSF